MQNSLTVDWNVLKGIVMDIIDDDIELPLVEDILGAEDLSPMDGDMAVEPIAEPEFSKGYIVLPIPYEAAREIAFPDGEPPEDLHMTLACIDGVGDYSIPRLREILSAFAMLHPCISARVSGVGTFAQPQEGQNCRHLLMDGPDLSRLREELVTHLERNAFYVDRYHGFTPHVTLLYQSEGEEFPDLPEPLADRGIVFERIEFWQDGVRYSFPLQF